MSNTFTYEKTSLGQCLTYANDEWAWITGDYMASSPMHSSAIKFWKYDTKTNELIVQYKNSDTFYYYEGVPFATMFSLLSADSLGAFIAKEIKPIYGLVS